jgi:trehalose-phosphatase
LIEEKKFSVAVHFRFVEDKYFSKIKAFVASLLKDNPSLRLMEGKKVFEILPTIDWDKGKAIRTIIQALNLSWTDSSIVYIGDDTTDEDAFRMVKTRGTAILVADKEKESAADFRLISPLEVKKLFDIIFKG